MSLISGENLFFLYQSENGFTKDKENYHLIIHLKIEIYIHVPWVKQDMIII